MVKEKLTKDRIVAAFRVYHTLADAARAMGVTAPSLRRACYREGVPTPARRQESFDKESRNAVR